MSKKKGKKSSKKKKGKSKGSEDEKIFELEKQLLRATQQIETYERFLVLRSEQSHKSKLAKEKMKEKLDQLDQDFSREKEDRFSITSDMIRQYKNMKKDLVEKIDQAERRSCELEDQLAYANIALEKQKEKYEQIIETKQKEIESQKQKMEEMIVEFQEMFKDVLSKMGSTISDSSLRNLDQKMPNIFQNQKLKDIIGGNL